jgi:hypothetical protein
MRNFSAEFRRIAEFLEAIFTEFAEFNHNSVKFGQILPKSAEFQRNSAEIQRIL